MDCTLIKTLLNAAVISTTHVTKFSLKVTLSWGKTTPL